MPRIPKELWGPSSASTTATTLYTVPSTTKTIIRQIHVDNPTGGALTITLSLGADATATRLFDAYSIPANSVFDHFCFYVIEAGTVVQGFASATTVVWTASGEECVLG
jgi:hypothetical protein